MLPVRYAIVVLCLVPPCLPIASHAQGTASRAPDSLLYRPALQQVVEWQTARRADSLMATLAHPDAVVRARAALALASVQDSNATAALTGLLQDDDVRVRRDAAFALGQAPGAVPSGPLLDALRHQSDETFAALLLEALGKTGDQASLQQLMTWEPVPPALQPALALAIGRYGLRDVFVPEALDRLTGYLRSTDPTLRLHAAYFFARTPPEAWSSRIGTIRARLDALRPNDAAAAHLLRGLGRLGKSSDADRFARWLATAPDWRVRVEAARALTPAEEVGEASGSTLLDALATALDDPSPHVTLTVARSLASRAPWPDTVARTLGTWVDAHPDRPRPVAALLEGFAAGGDASRLHTTLDRWRTRSPSAYPLGLAALAAASDERSLRRLLLDARDPDAAVATAALDALRARWERVRAIAADPAPYYFAFTEGLRRADLATMYASAPALTDSAFVSMGAASVLREVYRRLEVPHDVEAMAAILGALGRTGDASSVSFLQQEMETPHAVLREAAAQAIASLSGNPTPQAETDMPSDVPAIDWDYLRRMGPRPLLLLTTEHGRIDVHLDAEQTPLTTQTILRLAEEGRYDGVPFHRVVPNFVIQGGDFERGDGFGGPGFIIRSEFARIPYDAGTIGMASAGKDTEGSQFFFTHSMQPHLDGRYTAFGAAASSQEVIDRVMQGDRIERAEVRPTTE